MDFVFPNEAHVTWTVMIVLYPYITGLVAGAFIMSSLYHVFGRKELWPIGRFSLVASFAFMLVATLPLVNHLATRSGRSTSWSPRTPPRRWRASAWSTTGT